MKRTMMLLWLLLAAVSAPALAAATPPGGTGKGVHYLYLIRHGDYDREADPDADDVTHNGLNEIGRLQARRVGARLAALPRRPHALITSPFRRARETAAEISAALGMPATVDTLLHECTPRAERADYMKNHTPEDIAACDSNLAAAWRVYAVASPDSDRRDVLVCHGNVIRWMVARALCGDPRGWPRMDIANASITVLAVRADGSVRLVCFSDSGHLAVEEQTWAGPGPGWGSARRR